MSQARPSSQLNWYCRNKTFTNKWHALQYSHDYKEKLYFNFYDHAFSNHNWKLEPPESWHHLLHKRALQLRDKYDYIRLFYSGGVDSQTMLNTFLKNRIHIDEILVYRCSVFTEDFDNDPAELELSNVAIPFLKKISKDIPKTKITILKTPPQKLNSLVTESYFYEETTYAIRPWCEQHLYRLHPQLNEPVDKGLFHCDLRGGDKPKVFKEDGIFHMAMWDSSRTWDIGDKYLENFYITPEMPDVHSKQCHMLVNFFKGNHIDLASEYMNVFNTNKLEVVNRLCRDSRYKEFNLGKGIGGVLSAKQILVQNAAKKYNPQLLAKWNDFLKNEGKTHQDRFNDNQIQNDFKGILSHKYPLE